MFFAASHLDPSDRSHTGELPQAVSQSASEPASDDTEVFAASSIQFEDGALVCDRYRIRRYIARGGMGEVYEADDLEMDIVVAIKIMRPEVFAGADIVARFKREIELARRVSHPNIGRIHDIGHYVRPDGRDIPFLTMEFLQGETLAQRIARAGALPEPDALPLIRDMVSALDAIHRNGIVHRDFKSANVMLVTHPEQRLSACVMDFGLARPTKAGDNTLTRTGLISGTPAYMPPEQFEGIATPASDVYALGVVLHEVLTGIRPVRGAVSLGNNLPPEWAPLVLRCLAMDPAARFQNAGELLAALPGGGSVSGSQITHSLRIPAKPRLRAWVWIAAGSIALLGAAGWAVFGPGLHGLQNDAPRHLALLPILSDSADPMDAAFCAGFSDTIRGDLAEIETASKNSLWVVPSAEVRGIKTASQAYREVGANLVLVATLHRTGAGVSLTAELVDAKDRRLLKSATIEVDTLPALRNAAVTRIAALLDIPVAKAMTREMAASSTSEPGAFEYYEQGLGYLQGGNLGDVDQAIGLFKKALEKDREYALAYAGLGEAYAKKYKWTKDPQWVGMAVQNGNRAIRMNGSLAQVHSTMGVTYSMTGHSDLALAELQKAVQIEPACMLCFHHLGDAYLTRGQLDEAEKSYAEITRNQRGNVLGYSGLAKVAEMRGDLPKAEQMYRHALNLAPDRASAAANLGGIYIEMGRNEDAIPVLLKALSMQPSGDAYSNLGAAYMYLGRYPEAADSMEHAVQLTPNDHDYWRNLADSYRQVPALRNKADGAYRKALQLAQAALAVKPGDVDLLSSMGLYYAHLGETRKAETFTEQALKKAPDNSQVLFTSALAAELTGRRKKALNLLAASAKAGYAVSLIEKEPELISLQSDPDYRQWVEKVREPGTVSH